MSFLFIVYVTSGYSFIILNIMILYTISFISGILSVIFLIIHVISTKDRLFLINWHLILIFPAILLISMIFYEAIDYTSWSQSLILVIFYPVVTEEIFFRYYIQQILLKNINPISAIIIQSLCYLIYYSRFLIVDNGKAFPFPYNIIMAISIFGMGTFYGILTYAFKNIYVSSIVHFIIWSSFPMISIISPGIASSIIPS